jgi:hypothetical protein
MRAHAFAVVVSLSLALGAAPAHAQDPASLRRELEQVRQQFEAMKEQYQKAIDNLTERLQRLEAAPPPAPTAVPAAPGAPPVPPVAATPAPAPTGRPSLADLARPREPFALYERRGAGQLLFDMGVTGDFAGSVTSKSVEKARVGSIPGEENRFAPREIEVSFFGQIDPFARAEVRIEAGDELEADGTRSLGVSLAEANLTLLTLPWGTQLKLGRMRNRFGYLNEFHQHDRPFIDNPNVYVQFFGDEGLAEDGAELAWVAPLPVYLQAIAGVFTGDNDVAFGAGTFRNPLVTGRLRTFFEPTDTLAVQLGVSGATGGTTDDQHASYAGVDLKLKYTPETWRHPLLTAGGELMFAHRRNLLAPAAPEPAALLTRRLRQEPGEPTEPEPPAYERRDAYGYYVWGSVQPWSRWILTLRYDWTEYPTGPGHEWAIGPSISFFTTEFLRFRLGYKHTERSGVGTGPRTSDEVLFQGTFILGAHPADLF